MSQNAFPEALTKDEEANLIRMYTGNDPAESKKAKDELITRNLRLVAHIAKKYSFKDNEDAISIGTIGLIKAILTFKPDKGTRLGTYAARCIENEILMSIRAQKKHNGDIFLQDPIGVDKEGNEVTVESRLAYESYSIEDQIDLKMNIRQLYRAIKHILTDREKEIIEMRYGFFDKSEKTQNEIAEKLRISRSYVSRIEKKAIQKLAAEMCD
jgi:RNA polymerase sporulation-specific sigma factor